MAATNLMKPLASLSRFGSLQTRSVSLKAANIPIAKYGGRHTVTMMPGDGIGPEMMGYVKEVFRYAGAPIDFETVLLDPTTDNYDDLYNAISSVKRNGVGIKGNIETKMNRPDIKSRNVEMRNELDLFVNTIHCKSQPGVKTRHDDIDIVVSIFTLTLKYIKEPHSYFTVSLVLLNIRTLRWLFINIESQS